jgi:uncharacterized protein YdbL (DUF1318 family)
MNGHYFKAVFTMSLCVIILGAVTSIAWAGAKEDIVDRMAKRLETVKKFKTEGKIGETFDGRVDAVKATYLDDKTLKKLVDDENTDRKAFYALGAKELGTTPESFALSAGKRNFAKARPEDWLKPKDGQWVQKKNFKD